MENARRKNSLKRGGNRNCVDLDESDFTVNAPNNDLLLLDEALKKFAKKDKVKADLVKLRYFAGLSNQQAAEALGISSSTADNYWSYARSWLRLEIVDIEETE